MPPQSNNLLGMMLDLAKHEVFTDDEILDEVTMFYVVSHPCKLSILHNYQSHIRRDTRPRQVH